MTRLITYADENMTRSGELCAASALNHNVHQSHCYGPADLPKTMVKPGVRGAGCFWLFKPYLIDREIRKMKDGDFLVYADAGVEIVNNINYITERTADVFLFGNMYPHFDWCKFLVLDAMLPDWKQFASPNQVQASVILIRVNLRSKQIISDWLKWCKRPGMIDDTGEAVKEHRHDQAILTNIAMMEGIDLHWWPATYGQNVYPKGEYQDNYPVLFSHHRRRNNEWH